MITPTIMEMKITVFWFLILFFVHSFKCDISFQSLLRKMRFIRKEKHASFDDKMPLRIRATKGRTAFLTCIVKNTVNETISWIRHQNIQILTVDKYVFTGDKRFEILNENPTNWTLKINNVGVDDAGIYECQISTQPIVSFLVYLSVSETLDYRNPNSIDQLLDHAIKKTEEKSNRELVNDGVADLYKNSKENYGNTIILEGSEVYLKERDTLTLTCEVHFTQNPNRITTKLRSSPKFDINLVWFHDNEIISQNTSRDGTSIITENSSTAIYSILSIYNTIRNDSGNYVCFPFLLDEATIKVYITNGNQSIVPTNILISTLLFLYWIRFIRIQTFTTNSVNFLLRVNDKN